LKKSGSYWIGYFSSASKAKQILSRRIKMFNGILNDDRNGVDALF